MQQIYRRIPMPKCNFNKVQKQFYWNHTSAWVFSCTLAAYFQQTFSWRHLWTAASNVTFSRNAQARLLLSKQVYAMLIWLSTLIELWYLLKSHFGMGVLLWSCYMFAEQLFLRTPLGGCLKIFKFLPWLFCLYFFWLDNPSHIFRKQTPWGY